MPKFKQGENVVIGETINVFDGHYDALLVEAGAQGTIDRVHEDDVFDYDVRFPDGTIISFNEEELLYV